MKAKLAVLTAFAIGLFSFGGAATAAYAASLSATVTFGASSTYNTCYRTYAATDTGGPQPASGYGNVSAFDYNYTTGTCKNAISASIGNASFLVKTNGSACATASATYAFQQSKTRAAYYNSTACGSGVQLRGSTTSYGYVGTGYVSRSLTAPYLTF